MMHKLHNVLVILALMICAMLFYGYYLAFWPVEVFELNSQITVDKDVYAPGDVVIYTIDYCKHRDLQAQIGFNLVDTIIIPYAYTETNIPCGCNVIEGFMIIPTYAPEGTFYFQINSKYNVNFLKEVEYTFKTVEFEIKK